MTGAIEKDEAANQDAAKEVPEEAEGDMKSYVRIFSYADRGSWILNIVALLCTIGSGTLLPLMDLVFGKSVTTFNSFGTGSIDGASFRSQSTKWTLWFVYLFLARFALTYIWTMALNISATRTTKALRVDFLKHTLRQDVAFFDSTSSGAVSIHVTTNGNLVNNGISEKLGLACQGVATFVAAFAVAFAIQWKLTLITIAVVPTIIIVTAICVGIDVKQESRILPIYSRAGQLAEEVFSSMRTVHAFWAHPQLSMRYESLLENARKEGMKKSPNYGVMFSTEFFCVYAGYGLAFWQGIRLYAKGEIKQSGDIVTVIFAVIVAATALTQVAPQILHITKAASAAHDLFKIIDREPIIDSLSESGEAPTTCHGDIELRGIQFAYPSRPDVPVLQDFNISIPANKTTALVGASGSGKSTIIGLLERWYAASAGTILMDGIDIANLKIEWLRTNVRLVQQEPVLFSGTVFQNVAFGLVGTAFVTAPYEEQLKLVQAACKQAYAHDFIEDLPEGYSTEIGERAGRLSGGQKQRIAIARSIISNPKVLLLDEATSALDPKAERVVQDALDNVSSQRTTLMIAHKLSTVRKADNIAVMSKGAIIEQGTHEELIALHGAYSRLVKAQDLHQKEFGDGEDEVAETKAVDPLVTLQRTKTTATSTRYEAGDEKDDTKRRLNYSLLRCLTILLRDSKDLWVLYMVVLTTCVLGGLTFPALATLFARVMSAFLLTRSEMVKQGDFYSLMFFIVALAVFGIYFVLGWMCNAISQTLTKRYRLQMFNDVLRQDMSFFDKPENTTGAIVSRLSTEPTHLQDLLGFNVALILIGFVNVIASSTLAIAVGWKLGLVVVFGALPAMVFCGYLRIRLTFKLESAVEQRFAESAALASEAVSAIRTVASLALEKNVLERYENNLAGIEKKSIKSVVWTMFWFSLTQSINFLAMALGFWYGSQLLSTGEYSNEQFFIVFISVIFSGEAAAQFFSYTTSLTQAQGAANYMLWLKSREPIVHELGSNGNEKPHDGAAEVECKAVSFSYPLRPEYRVLRRVNAAAKPGQSIAFVGASGCGKSTMIGLLERFYDPSSGSIILDGSDISTICPRVHRSQIALVQQEPTLYQLSVRENVALGVEGHATDEHIEAALRKANIFEFITSLPEGMNTLCGSRGTQLSGGQRQRIAIARALIRKPRLLLLDEATSALDTESEKLVQAALKNGSDGCTTIAVAHRLSTIKDCDAILVFSKGLIVESGTHQQLLAKRGMYYEMCLGQSLDQEV
ncbi:P-loop containing nucleoside triphosphate hydrolase protein [Tothia fuscella]|uniref:P-loop containing nucleoside triphosphate hydrolase protein n=1 Tax=Tothia fuscella TaxID=1048955 RepID=A0A9P4NPN2_9PEZI|nr:P-loop containing nucleoside triphosphate hydrolase protein [Tothia fuscella]